MNPVGLEPTEAISGMSVAGAWGSRTCLRLRSQLARLAAAGWQAGRQAGSLSLRVGPPWLVTLLVMPRACQLPLLPAPAPAAAALPLNLDLSAPAGLPAAPAGPEPGPAGPQLGPRCIAGLHAAPAAADPRAAALAAAPAVTAPPAAAAPAVVAPGGAAPPAGAQSAAERCGRTHTGPESAPCPCAAACRGGAVEGQQR